MNRDPFAAMAFAAAVFAAPIVASAQSSYPNTARDLAANCANCHGTEGRAVSGMPRLAGRARGDISRAMREFRDGKRPGTVMPQLSKGYTDAEIDAMARYFASMPQQVKR
jgi:cytochrome c553